MEVLKMFVWFVVCFGMDSDIYRDSGIGRRLDLGDGVNLVLGEVN